MQSFLTELPLTEFAPHFGFPNSNANVSGCEYSPRFVELSTSAQVEGAVLLSSHEMSTSSPTVGMSESTDMASPSFFSSVVIQDAAHTSKSSLSVKWIFDKISFARSNTLKIWVNVIFSTCSFIFISLFNFLMSVADSTSQAFFSPV